MINKLKAFHNKYIKKGLGEVSKGHKHNSGYDKESEKVNPEIVEGTESNKDLENKDLDNELDSEETQEERMAKAAASIAEELAGNSEDENKKDAKDILIEELNDRIKRNMAEFDNFRKRTEKEKSAMFDLGAKNILEKILPTVDNFERALKSVPEDKECEAFAQGMDMIYKQLLKNLEEVKVVAIDCVGKQFDPNLHNAVMHVEDENVGENTVVEEFQKGYTFKDSVLRHSVVKVAN
jgi:grpE